MTLYLQHLVNIFLSITYKRKSGNNGLERHKHPFKAIWGVLILLPCDDIKV